MISISCFDIIKKGVMCMEKIVQEAMNDSIIKASSFKYGVAFEKIKRLGGFENHIYEYEKDGREYVIRYVHSHHRSYELVFAELEFIEYLSKNGANVSTVIHTIDDELLFKVPANDGYYFTVCVFTKAKGTYVKSEDITDEFIVQFGQAVGMLHRLTKLYNPNFKRQHFYQDDYIEMGRRNLKEKDQFVIDRAIEITEKIKNYEQSIDDYGLIHTDLHFGNMYYDGSALTFFDFDDASYKHFISDIAIILFYKFGMGTLSDRAIEDKSIRFLSLFVRGYEKENTLDIAWYKRLNDFFMLRQVILYMVIHAAGEEMIEGPWGKQFLDKYGPRIKNNTPFLNVERVVKVLWNS
jgi:Ser/Thr protein kinase RdoA (MazF antagonist)